MKNGTVPLITPGQVKDLGSALVQAIPIDIPADVAQGWIGNKRALHKLLRDHLMPPAKSGILAPEGGRIHTLRVPVNPAWEWQEAVSAAGPDTPQDFNVRKVGDQYPPQKGQTKEREVILVNFGTTIPDGQHALDWAKQYNLRPADPRVCFAVGEHKPNLHKELGMNPMAVVSLMECSFEGGRQVCDVWWDDAKRYANLNWFRSGWRGYYWFAFVRVRE